MIYTLEALRRRPDGSISHVRWHSVTVESDDLRHGPSEVVPLETAMRQAVEAAVHVCYRGAPGSKVGVGQTATGTSLVDFPTAPSGQRLEDLATF